MKRAIGRTALVAVLVLVGGLGAKLADFRSVAQMAEAANAFVAALDADQRSRATFAFESEERLRFHFIPTEAFERRGVTIEQMTPAQRERAHALLRAGLSQRGYMTATQIMEAEGILQALEGDGRRFARNPLEYYVSVFGTPSTTGTWGWRWEGHHLSLHFTVVEGDLTVSSPTFLAANPAEVPEGPRRGMRPLGRQEDAGRALLGSLTPEQRDIAIIDDVAPRDIVQRVALNPDPLEPVGIPATELTPVQRDLLMDIVAAWVHVMADDVAELRMEKVREGGVDDITFAWAGGTLRGELSYFRVQGPTFLIEYDNTMNDPNHIHSAWRELEGELGFDLLGDHVNNTPH